MVLSIVYSHLDKVHDIRPPLQGDDQEDGDPGQPDVVKWDGTMEGVGGTRGAHIIVLTKLHLIRYITLIVSKKQKWCQTCHTSP